MFENQTVMTAIISGIVSFILGGGLIAYLKFYRDKKTDDRSFAEKERDEMRIEIERLKKQVAAMSAQLIPSSFPIWIKDSDGKYIYVNHQWEIQVGARINKFHSQVVGFTDAEIFDLYPEFAELMRSIDREASKSGGVAVRYNVTFPERIGSKIIVKEIVVRDLENLPVYRGCAIPVEFAK